MLLVLCNMLLLLYFWFKTTQIRTRWVKKKNNVGAAVLGLVILTELALAKGIVKTHSSAGNVAYTLSFLDLYHSCKLEFLSIESV